MQGTYQFHRTGNGSTRLDRVDRRDSQILDMGRRHFFRRRLDAWTQHPARAQAKGGQPFLRISSCQSRLVPPADPRVRAFTSVAQTLSFREVSYAGSRQAVVYVPELNNLEVWERREAPYGVVEKEITWIVLGEPTVEFGAPEAAAVTVSDRPDGPGVP